MKLAIVGAGVSGLTAAHYVPTLRHWRERLIAHLDELQKLGYDNRFQRIWMLYLAYCEAGFAAGRIGDFQLLLTKPESQLHRVNQPLESAA
jgi:cyclopropane fatty-acyl-phospholipid synthase-like methyltransferase